MSRRDAMSDAVAIGPLVLPWTFVHLCSGNPIEIKGFASTDGIFAT